MILDGKRIKIKNGKIVDNHSRTVVYKHYASYLYGLALRYTKSREDAQDVLQDAFIMIFESMGQYSEKGDIQAWMTKIVINRALSLHRIRSKHIVFDNYGNLIESVADDNVIVSDMFAHEILLGFIRDLPPGYQLVFNMYAIEGYSHEEIAKVMNCSPVTCRSQLSKAKNALRKMIDEFNEKENENLM
jgi:RNA polymerase sigma-70 factor (ECF subfamily)